MLCPPLSPAPIVQNWIERHRDRRSLVLHIIGIPLTIMGILVVPIMGALASRPLLLLSVGLFVGGYLIQFLGHALDGTEPGEWTGLKRALGRLTAPALSARPESSRGVA